jgi:hypothetical protein
MTPPLHSSRWLKATNGGLPSDQIVRRKTQWLRAVAMDMLRKMMRKSPAEETGLERASRWLQDASNGKRSLDVYTYAHKRTQTHTHTDLYICVCVLHITWIFLLWFGIPTTALVWLNLFIGGNIGRKPRFCPPGIFKHTDHSWLCCQIISNQFGD